MAAVNFNGRKKKLTFLTHSKLKNCNMIKTENQILRLFALRNQFGKNLAHSALLAEKNELLNSINIEKVKNKNTLQTLYEALLFTIAYPNNKTIYTLANRLLLQLQEYLQSDEKRSYSLYNTGITGTSVCAAFSFEMVKWLRKTRPESITLISFEAGDAQIQSILSVVMLKTESEILQDANAEWKGWLKHVKKQDEDLLDQFISIFDSSDVRPEVKEELWNTIGINVAINFTDNCCLPQSLVTLYYHRSLIKKEIKQQPILKPVKIKLTESESEKIIDCCKMILVRKLRELDPISFTTAKFVSYYKLTRGISIALMGMVPERRHPIDSYMGYVVFKNGLPVAYAGSWILFDSARIGLNVFTDYRGGESKYIFEQVLQLHAKVYGLKRFTVDPYQIGKYNSDGINSGAFWMYYHTGFSPLQKQQQELATAEQQKIKANKKYRSPLAILKTLANSRMQLVLQKGAVSFDATDISQTYAAILANKYKGDRNLAEKNSIKKLAVMLQIKNYEETNLNFILKNWAVLLLSNEKELRSNSVLRKMLKKLFVLKANGSEEAYITGLQNAAELKIFTERIIESYLIN